MNGQIDEEKLQTVLNYLDKIAAKLNIGLHEVWPFFMKQQFIDAYISLSFLLITTIIATICLWLTIKLWRKDIKYDKHTHYYSNNGEGEKLKEEKTYAYSIYHRDHEPVWLLANAICIGAALIAGLVFYMQFFDILNPKYFAFKDIVSLIATIH